MAHGSIVICWCIVSHLWGAEITDHTYAIKTMDKSEISDKPLGTHIESCSVWFSGQLGFLLLCIDYVSPCLTWIHYVKQIHVVKLGKKKKKKRSTLLYLIKVELRLLISELNVT